MRHLVDNWVAGTLTRMIVGVSWFESIGPVGAIAAAAIAIGLVASTRFRGKAVRRGEEFMLEQMRIEVLGRAEALGIEVPASEEPGPDGTLVVFHPSGRGVHYETEGSEAPPSTVDRWSRRELLTWLSDPAHDPGR